MISAKAYETMRKKYGGVSSWEIWEPEGDRAKSGVGDLSIFNPVDLSVLNTGYVFVGLNVAGEETVDRSIPDWSNFHSEYRTHQDIIGLYLDGNRNITSEMIYLEYLDLKNGGADKILDQNKINNRRRSRICIPTKKGLKP